MGVSSLVAGEGRGRLSTVLGHPCVLRQQPRPRTLVWPLVATWASDINTDPGCHRTMDLAPSCKHGPECHMASGGCIWWPEINLVYCSQALCNLRQGIIGIFWVDFSPPYPQSSRNKNTETWYFISCYTMLGKFWAFLTLLPVKTQTPITCQSGVFWAASAPLACSQGQLLLAVCSQRSILCKRDLLPSVVPLENPHSVPAFLSFLLSHKPQPLIDQSGFNREHCLQYAG